MLLFRLALARSSSACQTSLLARLSGKIHSLPGRVKRGKAVTTPEQLLFRFALARSSSACQIKQRLPDQAALARPRRLPDFQGESNPSQAEQREAKRSRHLSRCFSGRMYYVRTTYVLRTYYVRTTYVLRTYYVRNTYVLRKYYVHTTYYVRTTYYVLRTMYVLCTYYVRTTYVLCLYYIVRS